MTTDISRLDMIIAKKIMNWKLRGKTWYNKNGIAAIQYVEKPGIWQGTNIVWCPTNNISQAVDAAEAWAHSAPDGQRDIGIEHTFKNGWHCLLRDHAKEFPYVDFNGHGATPSEAICLALVAASE